MGPPDREACSPVEWNAVHVCQDEGGRHRSRMLLIVNHRPGMADSAIADLSGNECLLVRGIGDVTKDLKPPSAIKLDKRTHLRSLRILGRQLRAMCADWWHV